MKRPRQHEQEEEPGHERWLLSYADFITLLFAFFVVMYALSSINTSKYQALSNSLNHAFDANKSRENSIAPNSGLSVMPGNAGIKPEDDPHSIAKIKKERQLKESKKLHTELIKELDPMIKSGKVNVIQSERGIRIDIKDSLLFAPGEHHMNTSSPAFKTMQQILPLLMSNNQSLEFEGHTDNVPIKNKEFHSNWELSAMRATDILLFYWQGGLANNRMRAIAYGESKPIASNDTAEGRAENRRVSIVVLRENSF